MALKSYTSPNWPSMLRVMLFLSVDAVTTSAVQPATPMSVANTRRGSLTQLLMTVCVSSGSLRQKPQRS